MGVGKLEDELMSLGASREDDLPSELEQELRNQLTNLRSVFLIMYNNNFYFMEMFQGSSLESKSSNP